VPPIVNLFARYTLGSGMLVTPTISLWQSIFTQSGGTNQVGTLTISGSTYDLKGGRLTANQIDVEGLFRHGGGDLIAEGVITLRGGSWEENVSNASLGQLQVSGTSTLLLPTNQSSILRFADSHVLAWSKDSTLTIRST
jgi:hypothetical protein